MAEAEAEKPVVAGEGAVSPADEGPPPEVVPEVAKVGEVSGDYAYWKTYAGIWKLLQFVFGVIATISILICFIPEWNWTEHGICPPKWTTTAFKKNNKLYYAYELDKTLDEYNTTGRWHPEDPDVPKAVGPNELPDPGKKLTRPQLDYLRYYQSVHGFIYPPNWSLTLDQIKTLDDYLKAKGQSKIGPHAQQSCPPNCPLGVNGKQCYGGLTFADGEWGSGRHDVWLYVWTILIIGSLAANVAIIVFQKRDPNFVSQKQFPLMIYYIVILWFFDIPALDMLWHIVSHMVQYHITLPQAVPCLIGAIFSILYSALHGLSFLWNFLYKAP